MVCKKNNFINHSWLIGGNRVGFVTCRFIIFVFDGPVFQFVNCFSKNRETRVFRNSVDAFYCVLTKEDLCNLCMQQVLPYLETSIPKCSLVCRCLFGGSQNGGSDFFFVKKKGWKSADDPKQKSKTGYKPKGELGQLRSHLFLYFVRGLGTNFISFTFC